MRTEPESADLVTEEPEQGNCEWCEREAPLEVIPFHGYSLALCEGCTEAAHASGEAV